MSNDMKCDMHGDCEGPVEKCPIAVGGCRTNARLCPKGRGDLIQCIGLLLSGADYIQLDANGEFIGWRKQTTEDAKQEKCDGILIENVPIAFAEDLEPGDDRRQSRSLKQRSKGVLTSRYKKRSQSSWATCR